MAAVSSRKTVGSSSSGSGVGSSGSSSSSSSSGGSSSSGSSGSGIGNNSSSGPGLLCGPKQSYQLSHWWMLTTLLTPLREQDLTHIACAVHETLIQSNLTAIGSLLQQQEGFGSPIIHNLTTSRRGSPMLQKITSCTRILSVLIFARSEVALASPFNPMNPHSSISIISGNSSNSSSSSSGSSGVNPSQQASSASQQEVLKRLLVVKGTYSCVYSTPSSPPNLSSNVASLCPKPMHIHVSKHPLILCLSLCMCRTRQLMPYMLS